MMARGKHKLSSRFVESVTKAGHHSDGQGLYLIVRASGSKSWSYVWIKQGRRREMGLGGLSKVPLALAREQAEQIRHQIGRGLNPFQERAIVRTRPFGEVADMLLAELEKGWTCEKHGAQWRRALKVLCEPIRSKHVDEIETSDILKILKPVLSISPETGRRLRSRMERVLDYASAHNWRDGENPARWKVHLENILISAPKKTRRHFSAMPYIDVPEFMSKLSENNAMSAKALMFTILTAARTSETLGARWSEIDFENKVWRVPSERMKMRREHIVPLSDGATRILNELYPNKKSDLVFRGKNPDASLSNMAMSMVMRRMGLGHFTVHGFRSSFRDFAGDKTTASREVAEAALAHRVGNVVEAAYRRGSALEKRKELMAVWFSYCYGDNHSGKTILLRA